MTIQYLSSKRVEGLDAEKDTIPVNFLENGYSFTALDTPQEYIWNGVDTWVPIGGVAPAGVGGWKELARQTLSVNGNFDIAVFNNKSYLQFLLHGVGGGGDAQNVDVLVNGDVSNNYSDRLSTNGLTDTTNINGADMSWDGGNGSIDVNTQFFVNSYCANLANKEKLFIGQTVGDAGATGAGNVPQRAENYNKWSNTIDAITQIGTPTGENYPAGSELVVLGWDPADDNTGGFWEELASATETSGDTLSSGAFNPKKYLWVQAWVKYTGAGGTLEQTFNTDVSASYASRDSYNGGADGESPNANNIDWDRGVTDNYYFINQFIINNSANEKLCIGHQNRVGTVGSGVAPDRSERVDKWANTSSQITQIDFNNSIGGVDIANAVLKVWGSD